MGLIPADQVSLLLSCLLRDPIPQPGDDVGRAVAVDRLVESQRGIDEDVGYVRLGAFAQVPHEEAQQTLSRTRRPREVLVDGRQRGLRDEDRKRGVARAPGSLATGAPQDGPGDRDRLMEGGVCAHSPKITTGEARRAIRPAPVRAPPPPALRLAGSRRGVSPRAVAAYRTAPPARPPGRAAESRDRPRRSRAGDRSLRCWFRGRTLGRSYIRTGAPPGASRARGRGPGGRRCGRGRTGPRRRGCPTAACLPRAACGSPRRARARPPRRRGTSPP